MLYDAHNHLQDGRLDPWREEILSSAPQAGIAEMVVNGTREDDWPQVAALSRRCAWIRPSFGLHPWHVRTRGPGWLAALRHQLETHPGAAVGECGLDRWIENPDVEAQISCFRAQMALAVELDRPVTIHCLRAFSLLDEILRAIPLPRRGFLLHSYGGPAEMVPGFISLGAYFSISPYFAHPRKAAQLATFARIPPSRLLTETDAPDMRPPEELNHWPLHAADGAPLNHPANLAVSYEMLAKLHHAGRADLERIVAASHHALFIGA